MQPSYNTVIIGAGHNGLVAAAYLARAGQRVLVLEKNDYWGGATTSQRVFPDFDVRLSRYAYLVSLFPEKIVQELGLNLALKDRTIASFTPYIRNTFHQGLLLGDENISAQSLLERTGSPREAAHLRQFYDLVQAFADRIWDTMLQPLQSRKSIRERFQGNVRAEEAWRALVEEPLGLALDRYLTDDLLKGIVFTDAKIGVFTHPEDPSLLQNRTFLYHLIGNQTGAWKVPVGGMGQLAAELVRAARSRGAELLSEAPAMHLHTHDSQQTVAFMHQGQTYEVRARHVLVNAGPQVLAQLLGQPYHATPEDEGSVFKINMLCHQLPELKNPHHQAIDAFTGTFHLDEGYEAMRISYQQARAGQIPDCPPADVYCHTLTDGSILSDELRTRGFHTLTLFGLDLPYALFERDNEATKRLVLQKYLDGLSRYLQKPMETYLARDSAGNFCLEAKSPVDLERELSLHRGNIFHNALTFPFAESTAELGSWGVETDYPNVYLCGSGAKRGGAVSGIPGHNAAMKVLRTHINSATCQLRN